MTLPGIHDRHHPIQDGKRALSALWPCTAIQPGGAASPICKGALRYLSRGLSNKEIAQNLNLSEPTIKFQFKTGLPQA